MSPSSGTVEEDRLQRGAVSFVSVTKRFGKTVAVDSLDLDVRPTEFISLLGPSGCGKTTTLRMVSGFEQPTEGTIFVSGTEMTDVPAYRRRVNTVFQSYALFEHMTVVDNVAFGLRVNGVDRETLAGRVGEALEMVQLSDFAERYPARLSGGQQQRVALARAIVNEPEVLLLDEPLSALDLKLRQAMRLELSRLHRELGMTFVYVTHDQEEAMTMSDRIAVMAEGRIRQLGTPTEIYERPASRFVADFIGETNLLEVVGTGRNGQMPAVKTRAGDLLPVSEKDRAAAASGRRTTLAVRPQRVNLVAADQAPVPGDAVVRAKVSELLFLGDSTRATVMLTDGSQIVALRHNETPDGPFGQLRPGDDVIASWHREAACLVDD